MPPPCYPRVVALVALLFASAAFGCRRDDGTRDGARDTPVRSGPSADAAQDTADDGEACRFAAGAWHCRIGPGVAARVVAAYDSADTAGHRFVRSLEVYPERGALSRQSLAVEEGWVSSLEPYDVSAEDLDGDGYRDLRLRHQYGIAANEGHYVWRYAPAARRFAYDSLLSDETNVSADSTGCVRTFGSVGHGGLDQVESRYCLVDRGWVEVWHRSQEYDDDSNELTESIWERRGDSLVLVRRRPVRE